MSLRFTLPEDSESLRTHRIGVLCDYLTAQVMVPFLSAHGVRLDPRFERFLAPDVDTNPFDPTGTIDFYPPLMFLGQLGELEGAIRAKLQSLSIETGAWTREHYPGGVAVKVIHIPVVTNPTALDGPPEVTMSPTAGSLVLRDVLGYQPVDGRYEFTATDLSERITLVTDEWVRAWSCKPARGNRMPCPLSRPASPMTAQRIRRCLAELRDFARWAQSRKRERIEVS